MQSRFGDRERHGGRGRSRPSYLPQTQNAQWYQTSFQEDAHEQTYPTSYARYQDSIRPYGNTYNAAAPWMTYRESSRNSFQHVRRLKIYELRLLRAIYFQREAEQRHRGLTVRLWTTNYTVTFKGSTHDVRAETTELENILKRILSRTISGMFFSQKELLEQHNVYTYLIGKFNDNNIIAAWEVGQEVTVYSFSTSDLLAAADIIQESIVQRMFPLSLEAAHLIDTEKGQNFIEALHNEHLELLKLYNDTCNHQMIITGIVEIVDDVTKNVKCFIDENALFSEIYHFSPSKQKFIFLYWKDQLMELENRCNACKVHVSLENDGKAIRVSSSQKGLQLMEKQLQDFGNKIMCHIETITDQKKIKFLTSANCCDELDRLGKRYKCVMTCVQEANELQVIESSRTKTVGSCAATCAEDTNTIGSVKMTGKVGSSTEHSRLTSELSSACAAFEFEISGVRVSIKEGDIVSENVDVIVNSTNTELDLNLGKVSQTLKRICGHKLELECTFKEREIKERGITVTGAPNLKCQHIIHIAVWKFDSSLSKSVLAILTECEKLKLRSIAIPSLGTGAGGRTLEESASDILTGVLTFCHGKKLFLKDLRVVLYDPIMLTQFVDVCKKIYKAYLERFLGCSVDMPLKEMKQDGISVPREAKLFIYADSPITVQTALQDFEKLVTEMVHRKQIKDEVIGLLQEKVLRKIRGIGDDHDVIVDISQTLKIIEVEGTRQKVKDAVKEIEDILEQTSVSCTLPSNWISHKPKEPVKGVLLQTSTDDTEISSVLKNIRKTIGDSIRTLSIERIQNPHLYRQYQLKKALMEELCPGIENEKILWHGTTEKAIENINLYGFNRSYCGKNATAYGKGVYFAVNFSYSQNRKYSPADCLGYHYIYQCRVLVGHATKGHCTLRALPPRAGTILYDSATDDLRDPTIYVIFNDTQAYPEYLIKFK